MTTPLRLVLLALVTASPGRAGELVAGIELGGKGVKGTVVEYDPAKPGDVTLKDSATISTALADLDGGRFKPANIARSADAVRTLVKRFGDKHGIPAANVVVAGSSGIVGTNRDELSAAVMKVTGKPLVFITAAEEVGLTIQGLGLRKFPTPANVDIGGGNTKGGYYANGDGKRLVSFAGIPGTVALTTKAKAAGGDYPTAVAKLADELVTEPLKAVATRDTKWKDQPKIFLTGGSVWAAATLLHPAKVGDPLVPLTRQDAEAFLAMVSKDPTAFPAVDLSGIAAPSLRAAAEAELKKVRAVYPPESLLAGAHILARLFRTLPLDGKPTAFARSGGTAWILAYALAESDAAAPAAPKPVAPPPQVSAPAMPYSPFPPPVFAFPQVSSPAPIQYAPPVWIAPAPVMIGGPCPPTYGPRLRVGLSERLRMRR